MTWDATYYEDLAGLHGLLITFDDRLPSEQARLLHRFIEVGEYGLALEEITGVLAQHAIAITDQERGDMPGLGYRMKLQGGLLGLVRELDADISREAPPGHAGAYRALLLSSGRRVAVREVLMAARTGGRRRRSGTPKGMRQRSAPTGWTSTTARATS